MNVSNMIRHAPAVTVVVLAACAGTPSSTAPVPMTTAPRTAPARSPPAPRSWWCYMMPASDQGTCFDHKAACQAARTATSTDSGMVTTDCAEQPNASCLTVEHSSGVSHQFCDPTIAICRAHRDYEKRQPDVARVGECASTDPALAHDSEPHWWCLSLGHTTIGSCSRSKVRCEQDRTKAIELERGHVVDVSPCTSQATAQCFVRRVGTSEIEDCFPTTEICMSALERETHEHTTTAQSCGPVE